MGGVYFIILFYFLCSDSKVESFLKWNNIPDSKQTKSETNYEY